MDQERLRILKLLKEQKITVEEASELLEALEYEKVEGASESGETDRSGFPDINSMLRDVKEVLRDSVGAALSGIDIVTDHFETGRARKYQVEEKLEAAGVEELSLQLRRGDIGIRGEKRDDIELRGSLTADYFLSRSTEAERPTAWMNSAIKRRGDKFDLNLSGRGQGAIRKGDFELVVPENLNLKVKLQRGDLKITDMKQDVSFHIVKGDSSLKRCSGSLKARIINGDAEVESFSGDLDFDCIRGDLKMDRVSGAAHIKIKNGDIEESDGEGSRRLKLIKGDVELAKMRSDLEINDLSGDIEIKGLSNAAEVKISQISGDFEGADLLADSGNWNLRLINGDAQLGFTSGSGGKIEALARHGSISGDLIPREKQDGGSLSMEFGSGSANLKIECLHGDIELMKE